MDSFADPSACTATIGPCRTGSDPESLLHDIKPEIQDYNVETWFLSPQQLEGTFKVAVRTNDGPSSGW